MKKGLRVWYGLLTTVLLLTALSGCGKVDNRLLKKTTSAIAALETFESGGFRRDAYMGDTEAPTQTQETWFRPNGERVDWCMLTTVYGSDDALQMESAVAQRDGVMYMRYSTPDKEGAWKESNGAAPSDKIGFPSINCLEKGEDYEFFRKEKDGSIAFSYSQTGLTAFRAQLVALVKDSIPTDLDESQYTEEQLATVKEQYAYIIATAEQTKVTAFSGSAVLDEAGALLRHEMQYSLEPPEAEQDDKEGLAAASSSPTEMRFVTEILTRSDAEAEQKLAELFAQLPR